MLEIALLGPLTATVDGVDVPLRPGRSRIVLAHLALEEGRTVPRAALIRSLWDDEPPASAVNVVQVAVSSLRRELGAAAVRSSPAGYAIGDARIDAAALLDGVRRGTRAAEAGDDVAAGAVLAPVLERFRTPLEDLGDSPFVTEARRSITERYLAAVEVYSAAAVRSGRADTVVGLLPDLVRAHPLREGLLEQLVLALGAVGRETEALAAYETGRARIADELGVDPGTRLRTAYERVLRQDLPLQGAASVHRLRSAPAPTAGLVGRDSDLVALTAQLERPEVRLLTLVGPAGIGKSRLAEALAGAVEGASARVSGATTAEALAAAVVRDVVEPRPVGAPLEALVQLLRRRSRTVLVLDDVAVGPAAAAFVTDLLTAVPGLQVVATARRPLRVAAETRYPVAPLSLVGTGGASPAAQLLASCLARDRGGRTGADDPAVLDAVARLCDGIPLAIELAAVATRVRSLEEVRDAFARSDAGALAAAMRSGLEDVPEDALALLRASACFVDGADLAALVAVAGLDAEPGEAAAVELRDRGLLVEADGGFGSRSDVPTRGGLGSAVAGPVDEGAGGPVGGPLRLRVLGPVREAVLARTDPAALDAVRAAYVAHHAARHAAHPWFLRVPGTAPEAADLARDLGNLRAALAVAVRIGSPLLPRMVVRLSWASTVFAAGDDQRRWRAAALAQPDLSDADRFDLLVAAPEADAELEEARRIDGRLHDPARTGWLRFREARVALDRGDTAATAEAIDGLAAVLPAAGDAAAFLRARLLDLRQMLALRLGAAEESLALTEQATEAAVDEGRLLEAELLEIVRIEVLIAAGRAADGAEGALDLLERSAGASPWLRGSTLSLRGAALLRLGAVGAAVDAQRTAIGLLLGSPWRIERLEALLRWAVARLAADRGDRDAGFVLGVWSAATRRLGVAPWPVEDALLGTVGEVDATARQAGEQAVRLGGPDRAVEDAMLAILDGRRLVRERC